MFLKEKWFKAVNVHVISLKVTHWPRILDWFAKTRMNVCVQVQKNDWEKRK